MIQYIQNLLKDADQKRIESFLYQIRKLHLLSPTNEAEALARDVYYSAQAILREKYPDSDYYNKHITEC